MPRYEKRKQKLIRTSQAKSDFLVCAVANMLLWMNIIIRHAVTRLFDGPAVSKSSRPLDLTAIR